MSFWVVGAPSAEVLRQLAHVYGPHVVLLGLSALTVFRREMSCNHCYHATSNTMESEEATVEEEDLVCENVYDDLQMEVLLESVGQYCSGASLLPALQMLEQCPWASSYSKAARNIMLERPNDITTTRIEKDASSSSSFSSSDSNTLWNTLPLDTHVHILSFLQLPDLVSLECTNKHNCRLTREPRIWKTLWERDYQWVVKDWRIGKQAIQQSCTTSTGISGDTRICIDSKESYVRFQLGWMNYVLAGQNTYDSCLVGLGGHVFDMSLFLASHPGSPETVMVQAGKDATDFFLNVRHSLGARRLALSQCVVVDGARAMNKHNEYCLYPTTQTQLTTTTKPLFTSLDTLVLDALAHPRRTKTLQRVRERFSQEQVKASQAARQWNQLSLSGEVHVYFDFVKGRWKAWYTNADLQTVHVDPLL
jgi:cytochrome b involved in lipid metabolism